MSLDRFVYFVIGCLCALALAGCGSGGSDNGGSSQVRFMNALVDAGAINVTVGSTNAATGLAFESNTAYQEIDSGSQEFKVGVVGGTSTIIDTTLLLASDAQYTYIVYGTSSAPTAQLVSDAVTQALSGQFQIRITNAAFGSAGLDVYITSPGASIEAASPNISNIGYGNTSGFVQLSPGAQQLRLTLHNSKTVIYDGGTVTFANQASYYFVAYTKGSSTLVNGTLFTIDTQGNGNRIDSKVAQFKLVHAAPGTALINALVDGVVTFANIPYQGFTSYEVLSAGTHTVTVQTAAAPGAVIASVQPPFPSATDTSIVVTGSPGAQTAVALSDNNLPGTSGSARLRFVNVATNVGDVDVLINFAKRVSSLSQNSASSYIELLEDTYAINFDTAGTTNVLLALPSVSLTAGRTYTLYLVGSTGQLTSVLTRDD